jgi:broad specificity phosphatase PhoE
MVMIIRHGEKPDGSAEGFDASGRKDHHSLTKVGWERARGLVGVFDPAGGHLRQGLATPKRIYAAGRTADAEGERTRETVAPLAAALGVPVTTTYVRSGEKELAEHVASEGGTTLISWQHNGIPDLVDAFPGVMPTPPNDWPDNRYDVIWTLTKTATGWHFAQMPELVLPGDQRSVIED